MTRGVVKHEEHAPVGQASPEQRGPGIERGRQGRSRDTDSPQEPSEQLVGLGLPVTAQCHVELTVRESLGELMGRMHGEGSLAHPRGPGDHGHVRSAEADAQGSQRVGAPDEIRQVGWQLPLLVAVAGGCVADPDVPGLGLSDIDELGPLVGGQVEGCGQQLKRLRARRAPATPLDPARSRRSTGR